MKIATIVPCQFFDLIKDDDYLMCLAHLMHDMDYAYFFSARAYEGKHIIMDNGVVETGVSMSMNQIWEIAADNEISEIILPDIMHNANETLKAGEKAFKYFSAGQWHGSLMAVPQGETDDEWIDCVHAMLEWPVRTIGISRFVLDHCSSRLGLLKKVEELIYSSKEIHLLGCPEDPLAVHQMNLYFHDRIRGVDSATPSFYTAGGITMGHARTRPDSEVDFLSREGLNPDLMKFNIDWWRDRCQGKA